MTKKSFFVIAIFSYVFLPIWKIDGNPVNAETILKVIKNDKEICETKSIFIKSQYANSCDEFDFPIEDETLTDANTKQFLCVGIYDRISRLCYLDSKKIGVSVLPKSTMDFDQRVEKFLSNPSIDVLKFCQKWNHTYPPKYSKTKTYVTQLETILKRVSTCIKICTNFKGEIEPLCAVLSTMDEISKNIEVGDKSTIEEHKENDKKSGENILKPDNHEQIGIAVNKNKSETQNNNNNNNTHANVPKNNKTMAEKNSEVQNTVKDSGVQPKAENDAITDKNSNKKVQESPTNLVDAQNTDDKPDLPQNDRINPSGPNGDQTPVISDNSVEDVDKISNEGKEQNTDVISEITQDHNTLAVGGDPSEDVNEIESPVHASNEDTNDSPSQTSEKRDYVPRIPGIRNDDDSHFFGYFTVFGIICLACYVGYHNKQKIFAMVLEGRRGRGGRGRRRPSTANYRKLDCTLEEAVTSQCNSNNVTHVIY